LFNRWRGFFPPPGDHGLTERENTGLLAGVSALQVATIGSVAFLAWCAAFGRLDFLREEFRSLPRRIVAGVLLTGILATVVFYPVTGGATVDVEDLWFPALFLSHALLAVFLVAWWGLKSFQSIPQFLALRMDHLRGDVAYGVSVGLAGWGITIAVTMGVAAAAFAAGFGPSAPQEIPPLMVWLAGLPILQKLAIIGAAMTVEEAFFRGFLQPRLGLWVSSILFALAHASYGLPLMIVSVLTISVLIGRAFEQRGRLVPCIVAHGVFDAIQLLIILPWAVRMVQGA
jgi:membrane protease YdiL (CAAX protease family)